MGTKSNQKRERRIKEGREATLPPDAPWTPFQRARGFDGSYTMSDGTHEFSIHKNSRYTVMRREFISSDGETEFMMVHLSIKRNDRKPILNWRDMQKIKNELVGPECEGVQIFPAESRLVDNANQYHLWVCSNPGMHLPFGYDERLVSTGNIGGSVQEPFEDHVLPTDLVDNDLLMERAREYRAKFSNVPG